MAYWEKGSLKRNLESAIQVLSFLRSKGEPFRPDLNVSFLTYEDVGYCDNQCLYFSAWYYNRHEKRRKRSGMVFIPFCLFLQFAQSLRRYNPNVKKDCTLTVLQEFDGANKRIRVQQKEHNLHLTYEYFFNRAGAWESKSGSRIVIKKEQIPSFISFLRCFGQTHKDQIIASMNRQKNKRSSWETSPPR